MTELERIQAAKAAIAQTPGGKIWLEELLVRGRDDGSISGGHAIYAIRAFDGAPPQMLPPFPLTVAANEPALAHVMSSLNAAAVDTVGQQEWTIDELVFVIDKLTTEKGQLALLLDDAKRALEIRDAEFVELKATHRALLATHQALLDQINKSAASELPNQ